MTARWALALALLAPACEATREVSADTPARLEAERVAEALGAQVGQGQAGVTLSEVRVAGEDVIVAFTLPTPGEDAPPEIGQALSSGIAESFGPQVCAQAGIDALFAAGGGLRIRVLGSDGVQVAEVPANCS